MNGRESDITKKVFSDPILKDEALAYFKTNGTYVGFKFRLDNIDYIVIDGNNYIDELFMKIAAFREEIRSQYN